MSVKFSLQPIQNGVLRSAAVDDILVPENTCQFALNLNFDRIGAIQLRKGVTKIGDTVEAGKTVLGMANYVNNAGTNYKLLAKLDTNVYTYNGTTWASVRSGLTASSKMRTTNFVDYTFMVNGNGNEVCASYAGTGSFGATNVADLPKGDFIENYRSRIWVADSSSDKVYYTNVVETDNTITGGTSFIQVSPQDGESITALKRHPRALLVFKQNHIYRIFSINSVDPDPSITRGTYSQESVVEAKNGIYYHHSSGFYKFNFDGEQLEISKPIDDIVQAIPRSYWGNVTGWCDDDHIYWSVGDITLDGLAYKNFVVRFTISTQIWTVYSYAIEIRSASRYDNGTTIINVIGDDTGIVYQFNEGTSDNGSPIHYNLQTHWNYLSKVRSDNKSFTEMGITHENAEGAEISYAKNKEENWRPLGQIEKELYEVKKINATRLTRIKFRINGNSVGTPFIFRGFEILNLNVETTI